MDLHSEVFIACCKATAIKMFFFFNTGRNGDDIHLKKLYGKMLI